MCPETPKPEEKTNEKEIRQYTFTGDILAASAVKKSGVELPSISETPEDERKGRARETISFILVFGLLALFFASFIFAGTVDEAIKLIQAISSALTGLIGAVLGYYFGATTAEKKAQSTAPT